MSIKRILLLALFLLAGGSAILWLSGGTPEPPEPQSPSAEDPASALQVAPKDPGHSRAVPPASAPPATARPALPPPPPDSETTEEDEAQSEKEQVDAALVQLNSSDPAQRVEAAEQLGAYPTKESEAALTQLLSTDSDPEVRSAAAQNLGYVERPSDTTLDVLLKSLEDQNEEVRLSALSTLEDFLLGSDQGSKRYTKIVAELQNRTGSQTIPEDTREAIQDVLKDQADSTE